MPDREFLCHTVIPNRLWPMENLLFALGQRNQHDSELRADSVCLRKNPHDLFGRGVSRDVVVGGFASQNKVAHASTHEIGPMAVLAQSADDRDGERLRHGVSS